MSSKYCPLAIVGMSCLFPKAEDLTAYWANIKGGVDAITPIPVGSHWNAADYFDADPKRPDFTYAQRGGFLSPVHFNPMEFGMAPKDIEATDTTQLLSLVAAQRALIDAGYATGSHAGRAFDRERTGVILGVTGALELVIPLGARLGHPHWRRALKDAGVEAEIAEDVVQRISDSYVGWQENSFPGLLGNVAAGRIANRLDVGGTNCVVDAACASSLAAIHLAGLELSTGLSDMVITGGVDTFNDIFMYMCFSKTPALSPTGDAKPFDRDSDGTILGEGIGLLVLKRLDDAKRDGDRIYAVLKGMGSSSDGRSSAIYAPRAGGQKLALQRAYESAGVTTDTLELLEAHGTGTKVGDATELAALTEVFQKDENQAPWCALGSVKSQIGHTKAAAGVAGVIKAAMALHHKVLPPTIKVSQPLEGAAPGSSPFYVNTLKRPWLPRAGHPRRAAVSALGFGGTNFHCVLEEVESTKVAPDWDGDVELLAISSASLEDLKARIGAIDTASPWIDFRRAAHASRAQFQASDAYRLVMAVTSAADRAGLKASALTMLTKQPEKAAWTTPTGIAFGSGAKRGKIGALFPGQGSQYAGMLRDLACQFPAMLETLAQANDAFVAAARGVSSTPLTDFIYPPPAFSAEGSAAQEATLKATEVAQPALGAVSLGALGVLQSFGVKLDAACGHSYGELVALCAAGRITPAELHRISKVRGQLMASRDGAPSRGAMLAVQADEAAVATFLKEEGLALVVANQNSPVQQVLAGETEEVHRAAEALARRSIRNRVLPVSAAFHSPLVADAQPPFAKALQATGFGPGTVPVYANTTGKAYPLGETDARALLAGQITLPVNFVQQIQSMHADGVETFLEIGPGHVLGDLVQAILPAGAVETIAVDASKGGRSGVFDLALTLARLASLGHEVALASWESAPVAAATNNGKPALTVPISGANLRAPRPARPPVAPKPAMQPVIQPAPSSAALPTPSVAMPAISRFVAPAAPAAAPVVRAETPTSASLQAIEEGILALQRLQEQTAQLHKQFLEGQESSRRAIEGLLRLQGGVGAVPAPSSAAHFSAPAATHTPIAPTPVPQSEMAVLKSQEVEALRATTPAPAVAPAFSKASPGMVANRAGEVLLSVVSEKTGYPVEMLNLSMGLDADLGIDSIKRVEIMAALRAQLPGAPEIKPEHLGSLQTLQQIVDFLAAGSATADSTTATVTTATSGGHVATASGALAANRAGEVLLSVVSEKTGYPVEMLNLSMGLDADLGIDSIKRVEIMAALRAQLPGAPEIKPEHLGSLQTLQQIVDFLAAGSATADSTTAKVTTATGGGHVATASGALAASRAGGLAPPHPSNVRRELVRPVVLNVKPARTQLSLAAGATVWLIDDGSDQGARLEKLLRARQLKVQRGMLDSLTDLKTPAPAALVMLSPSAGSAPDFLAKAFRHIQHAGASLRKLGASNTAILLTVSLQDGAFGFGAMGAHADPVSGGLAGLVKTARLEWPEVHCKAIDLDPQFANAEAAASQIVDEMFLDGPVEVGLSATGRVSLRVEAVPLDADMNKGDALSAAPLAAGDVVVISGGARGVTGDAACALAQAFRPTLVLLGRSKLDDHEPAWARGLVTEATIKKALFGRMPAGSAPSAVEVQYRQLLAQREIRTRLAELEQHGARALYRSVDVRDAKAVAEVLGEVRRSVGAIRGLIHGAGVLADRRIEDKTDEQFREVYGTKVEGLNNLLAAMAQDELKVLTLFSSYTGRYGRVGQVDYAAANEVLNKLAQRESRRRPGCRVVSVNWGPWNGGMVTPGLRKIFEAEGVGLIEPQDGAQFLVRELCHAGPGAVEVLALAPSTDAANGMPETAGEAEPTETDVPAAPALVPALAKAMLHAGTHVAFEREVSVAALPFLESHVINGRAVLPAALMVEWLAQAALHGNPGMRFHGLDDFKVLKGVILDAGQSITSSLLASPAQVRGKLHVVPVKLVSQGSGREILHAQADVLLSEEKLPTAPAADVVDISGGEIADAYSLGVLFHGVALHGIERVEVCAERGVAAFLKAASAPIKWMRNPLRGTWIADPLALDSAFQMMILWSSAHRGGPSLPSALGRYRQFVSSFPKTGCRAVIGVALGISAIAVASIQFLDQQGNLLASAEDCEFVVDAGLRDAFRLNQLKLEK